MRELEGVHTGDERVDDILIVRGTVTGNLRVVLHGVLRVLGTVNGTITLEPGGKARVDGTLNGDALNAGGELAVFGMVSGNVHTESGQTYIDPDAAKGCPRPMELLTLERFTAIRLTRNDVRWIDGCKSEHSGSRRRPRRIEALGCSVVAARIDRSDGTIRAVAALQQSSTVVNSSDSCPARSLTRPCSWPRR